MPAIRIVPRLDIKGPNLVKGIHLEGLRVLGKPWNFAKYYYETGADELLYVDVVASLYQRNSLHDIIRRTAQEIFIPLTVGGGLRTVADIRSVLRAGADKVAINTEAIKNPELIREASCKFGSSTIVISIQAKRHGAMQYEAYTDNGREATGVDVFDWVVKAQQLGAGEVLLTSIDQEGTGKGFDIELIQKVSKLSAIPLIVGGGAGHPVHVNEVLAMGTVDAVSIASMFHYDFIRDRFAHSDDYSDEGNVEFLKSNTSFTKVAPCGIVALKESLISNGFAIRKFGDVSARK